MFHRVIILLSLIINFATNTIKANELSKTSETSKKYKLSICTIFKNQAKHLETWIEYHHSFGIDHFYLYNTGSSDTFRETLAPYIEKGLVTLVNWPETSRYQDDPTRWALSTQIPAYENAVNFIARDETKWLIFIDVDEFLVSSEVNIKELLKTYNDFSCLSISSDLTPRTPNPLSKKTQSTRSLASITSSTQNINHSVTKMMFKPDLCEGFDWPPYQCRFKDPQPNIQIDRERLKVKRYTDNSFFENKDKSRYGIDYRIEVKSSVIDQGLPIYPQTPDFLKKLMQKDL